jgi:hypothetical protein
MDHSENSLSVVGKVCLQRQCIATEVTCVFVVVGMCLTSFCLAMITYSDFTTPAFGRHITTCYVGVTTVVGRKEKSRVTRRLLIFVTFVSRLAFIS